MSARNSLAGGDKDRPGHFIPTVANWKACLGENATPVFLSLLTTTSPTMDNFNFKEFQASELPQLSTTKLKPQSRLRMLWKLTAFVGLVYLLYPTLRSIAPKDLFSGHGCHRGAHSLKSGGLPTHYTLLSGDKIPSVQLGVWKSAPNEVGNAVKVCSALHPM